MKKILLVLLVFVLTMAFCSCSKENTFVEGNLLYDLGAKSFEDIEKVEFWHKEYQGTYEEKVEITEKQDIEVLCDYTYSSVYPRDKLHELLVFPTNSIYVTINGVQHRLFLGDDGSLTTVLVDNMYNTTYKAEEGKGITTSVWKEFIEKYD